MVVTQPFQNPVQLCVFMHLPTQQLTLATTHEYCVDMSNELLVENTRINSQGNPAK